MKYTKPLLLIFIFAVNVQCWARTPKEDTTFVNNLLQQSKSHFNDDPATAVNLSKQAQNISRRIKFLKGEAYALKNLGLISQVQGKYLETLDYFEQSLKIFRNQKDNIGIANLLNNIGSVYANQGDDAKALEYCLESLKIAEETKDKMRIMSALVNIGSIYYNKKDPRAVSYLAKALPLSEEMGNKEAFGVIAVNIGETYFDNGDNDKALLYYQKALTANDNSESAAFAYNGIGKLYLKKGNYEAALRNHEKAMSISKKTDDKLQQIRALKGIANIDVQRKNYRAAIDGYQAAKALAEEAKANVELKEIYGEMADIYSKTGNYSKAFQMKSMYANIKDSLYNIETAKKLKDFQFDFDLTKKQGEINLLTKDKKLTEAEVQRQRLARNTLAIGAVLLLIIAFVIYRNYRIKVKTNKILDTQKDQIERLLLDILPREVANELQTTGRVTPKHYSSISVLFTDFKNFTAIAEKMTPGDLVEELNTCFMAFDGIIERHGLEKIKTIGDSYMCAGGLSSSDNNHVYEIVKAGLDIQKYIEDYNDYCKKSDRECWAIRVGVHVGPVVAGVVGKKKYAYDIWGNTVNIASRMESNGAPEMVNISNTVYELVKDRFECSYRGKIYAKNVGDIDMYFVDYKKNLEKTAAANENEFPLKSSSEPSLIV
ncbi:MAG: tetratricopeptide repeat protein [Bacteroidota bacterium]|nr:tetratricopeptide repeat protein [Bacteroidota bacterium]